MKYEDFIVKSKVIISLSDTLDSAPFTQQENYSKIPILRPPLGLSKSGLKDHFWTVPKVVSNQRYTG